MSFLKPPQAGQQPGKKQKLPSKAVAGAATSDSARLHVHD